MIIIGNMRLSFFVKVYYRSNWSAIIEIHDELALLMCDDQANDFFANPQRRFDVRQAEKSIT